MLFCLFLKTKYGAFQYFKYFFEFVLQSIFEAQLSIISLLKYQVKFLIPFRTKFEVPLNSENPVVTVIGGRIT